MNIETVINDPFNTGAEPNAARSPARRVESFRPLKDGEDGLFQQSWYPICESGEVIREKVASFPFLDGRVVVFRGADNVARVLSAYCPHFGADLGKGMVIGNHVQCPWHKFEFDGAGFCRKTGSGDPPPPTARLFAFPTEERYGLIWAFNGEKPLFELPSFPADKTDLVWKTSKFVEFGMEPWLVTAAIADFSHFEILHDVVFESPTPWETLKWHEYGFTHLMRGDRRGERLHSDSAVWGTTILMSSGEYRGRWFGFMGGVGLPEPGKSMPYSVLAAERMGDEQETLNFLAEVDAFNVGIGTEDLPISRTLHFRVGTLTKQDAPMHTYFTKYMRNYPRAHPAAGLLS